MGFFSSLFGKKKDTQQKVTTPPVQKPQAPPRQLQYQR
jgi:hypothetical protein